MMLETACPACGETLTELLEVDQWVGFICPNNWCWHFIEHGWRYQQGLAITGL